MGSLADEQSNRDGKPSSREYLCFALALLALLLISGAQIEMRTQPRTISGSTIDPIGMPVSAR